jgi:hypothetical protein
MKKLLCLGLALGYGAILLAARPTSSSRSSGSGFSYGSSRTYTSKSSLGSSASSSGSAAVPSSHPGGSSHAWGSSTTYTSQSKQTWGGNSSSTTVAHTSAESSLNRTLNQTSTTPGGVSRAAAAQDRATAMAPRAAASSAAASAPIGYHASTDYATAVTYRHYYYTQPSIWPGDIPLYYPYGGVRYHVIWDPFYNSYGWYNPSHTWIYYDSMPALAPVAVAPVPVAVVHGGPSFLSNLFWLVVLLLILVVLIVLCWQVITKDRRRSSPPAPDGPGPQERTSYKAPVDTTDEVGTLTQGSVIRLTDAASMEDAIKLAPASTGLFVTVDKVLTAREKNDLCTWTLIYGTSEFANQELLIKVKEVGAQRDIVCYTRDVEGSREELLAHDNYFLFAQPADENNYNAMELRYARQFQRRLDGDKEDTFVLIHPHELHGSAAYRPAQPGVGEVLATVAEWRNAACETNEYIAIETGNGVSSNVEGWWGDRVQAGEIEFLSRPATARRR